MVTLSPEERAALNSLGLDSSSTRSPLKHFKGRLVAIGRKEEMSNYSSGINRNQLRLTLKLDQLEVYDSTSPYPWKTAEIPFTHGSQLWGIFGASLKRQLGPESMLADSIGKIMTIKLTPGHNTRTRNTAGVWEETKVEAFEIISVDGVGTVSNSALPAESTDAVLIMLADGATADIFEARIYQDSRVKGNTQLLGQLSLTGVMPILTNLESAGMIAKDDSGVYHKAPSPAPDMEAA